MQPGPRQVVERHLHFVGRRRGRDADIIVAAHVLRAALIRLHPRKSQVALLGDAARERRRSLTGLDAASIQAHVHFHEHVEGDPCAAGRAVDVDRIAPSSTVAPTRAS